MTDRDDRIEVRVRAAFAAEQRRAESDLKLAPLTPHRLSGLRLIPRIAAIALVAALVVAAAGFAYGIRSQAGASPSPSSSAGPSQIQASPSASPSTDKYALAGRYEDGIPRTWEGQPVLRGQAAIDAANASTDASSFLVAFWAGIEGPRSCVALGAGDNALYLCGGMTDAGDAPGVVSAALEKALRVDVSTAAPGPVIARVHTHDPALMTCPAAYAAGCVHTMVGEAIVWNGDDATAPHPTTVAQAAAAFGVSARPSAFNVCTAAGFTGAPILNFPPPGVPGSQGYVEAVVVVFPSVAALAAVAPAAAAAGESDVPPEGHMDCVSGGTDPLRGPGGFSFKIHWLARGNVLVGVQYDTSVGPQNDVIVAQVRAKLATLSAAGSSVSPTLTPSAGPSATSGSGTFVLTGPLPFPELGPGQPAALLDDGRVLVVGDTGTPAEALFDPATGRFSVTGSLSTRRANDTATRLKDGRVLVAGGDNETGLLASAELYDPATGKFSPTGSMLSPREFDTATLLADGRVLILGGIGKGGYLASAELYDPATGRFSSAGNTLAPLGEGHTATLLLDGRVLIAGGDGSSPNAHPTAAAELYDPASGKFSSTGPMTAQRAFHTATLLNDGRVLLAGGESGNGFSSSAELYDPASGTFGATGSMSSARQNQVAALLRDGRVLIAGGDVGTGNRLVSAELYDPATGRFSPTGAMTAERVGLTATLLLDGRVLVVGANVTGSGVDILNGAELYLP